MQLIKYQHRYIKRPHIVALLSELGIKLNIRRNALWRLPRYDIELIFEDAKKIYESRRVMIAPRKIDDDWNLAADLNALWQSIEKRFQDHLYPCLVPSPSKSSSDFRKNLKRTNPEEYKRREKKYKQTQNERIKKDPEKIKRRSQRMYASLKRRLAANPVYKEKFLIKMREYHRKYQRARSLKAKALKLELMTAA